MQQNNSRIANYARNIFIMKNTNLMQCRDLLKKKGFYMRRFSSILTLN